MIDYAAVHLKGADNIAKCFGVHRNTVVKWAKAGAPICYVGRCYQASYTHLCSWLEQAYAPFKPEGNERMSA